MVFNGVSHVLLSYRVQKLADDTRKPRLERDDLRGADFWRAVIAECLAVSIFIIVGPGSSVSWAGSNTPSNTLIALANGLTIATLIQCFSHVSGAHFNPCLTLPLVIFREISVARGICYVVAQCVGSACGAAILSGVSPADKRQDIGMTFINYDDGVSLGQGFAVELVITFQLVLMFFATIDPRRGDLKGSGALAIGLTVVTGLLYGIPYTGASMNPARSFGPALIANNWVDHWVYWVAPLTGGVLAASSYKFLFTEQATILRLSSLCCGSDSTDNDHKGRKGRRQRDDHDTDSDQQVAEAMV